MQLAMLAEPAFSRDGRWLGIGWPGGTQVQLLEVVPGREYRTIVSSLGARTGAYLEGDISPDGRLLALGMGTLEFLSRLLALAMGAQQFFLRALVITLRPLQVLLRSFAIGLRPLKFFLRTLALAVRT